MSCCKNKKCGKSKSKCGGCASKPNCCPEVVQPVQVAGSAYNIDEAQDIAIAGDVTFNTPGTNSGVTVPAAGGSTFVAPTAGFYNFQFILQLIAADAPEYSFALRVNGVNSPLVFGSNGSGTVVGMGTVYLPANATVTLRNLTGVIASLEGLTDAVNATLSLVRV